MSMQSQALTAKLAILSEYKRPVLCINICFFTVHQKNVIVNSREQQYIFENNR